MLEENDLQLLKNMMETVMDSKLTQFGTGIDSKFAQFETGIDNRFSQSENLVLSELERTRTILEHNIETVQKNLDQLKEYYRITKLENDNTTLLLQMVSDLQKRVSELEKKTA